MKKTSLILGVNGMSGSHMADILLEKGYDVVGTCTDVKKSDLSNIGHIKDKIHVVNLDISDDNVIYNVLNICEYDTIYNFAGMSSLNQCSNNLVQSHIINGVSVLKILEYMSKHLDGTSFFQSSSREMYGPNYKKCKLNELDMFNPISSYGITKLYAHNIIGYYRKYKLVRACSGIFFNHESERRKEHFVSRKIVKGVCDIIHDKADKIILGDITIFRDWGYCPDYMEAVYNIMQQETPRDYVIASGELHSIFEMLKIAFEYFYVQENEMLKYIEQDPYLIRQNNTYDVIGDTTKLQKTIGWKPKTSFKNMIYKMIEKELENY